jgi:hypothetical protein
MLLKRRGPTLLLRQTVATAVKKESKMNEYAVTFLAAERTSQFEREAVRDRLAAHARLTRSASGRPHRIARESRVGLGRLVARMKLGQSHG